MNKLCAMSIMAVLITSVLVAAGIMWAETASGDWTGDVIIDSNGDIIPETAPITRSGTTYRLKDNILGSITIQRSDITLEGSDHTVKGTGGNGILLSHVTGVTVQHCVIMHFNCGIALWFSSYDNTIQENTISYNSVGIECCYQASGGGNTISGNVLTSNKDVDILVYDSHNNIIESNTLSNGDYGIYGIYILSDGSNNIHGNTITGHCAGIVVDAIDHQEDETIVSGNTLSGCQYGIGIWSCFSPCSITGNTIVSNYQGIALESSFAEVRGNSFTGNEYGIYDIGGRNTIIENTFTGNTYGICWGAGTINGNTFTGNTYGIYGGAGTINGNTFTGNNCGIYGTWGIYNTYSGNTLTNNYCGMTLHCTDSTITMNTISQNVNGIDIYGRDNIISKNEISENSYGLRLFSSSGNRLYHNNIIDNTHQLYSYLSSDVWDNGAGEGNRWSDYEGLDDGSGGRVAGDGIGDTDLPHQGVDFYPMVESWAPIEETVEIIEEVITMDLPEEIEGPLVSTLDNAVSSIENENYEAAVGQLSAFINKVEAQRGKKITEEEADALISSAMIIIHVLTS